MGWCLECHKNPEPFLRPPDRVADMEWAPDRPQLVVGRGIKQKLDVHPTTDCTGCHR